MININGKTRDLKSSEIIFYMIFSVLLNSFANGLTIASNLGSAVWTASGVNLSEVIPVKLGTILFVYGLVIQAMNVMIRGRFDWHIVLSNLIFAFSFSYLVQFWTWVLTTIGVPKLDFFERLVLDVIGVTFIAFAVSIYQRVDVMLHPNDEFTYLIRFKYLHGNAAVSQYASYVIPIIIIIICFFIKHRLYSIGIGTFLALFFQGPVIGWADEHVFTHLKHKVQVN